MPSFRSAWGVAVAVLVAGGAGIARAQDPVAASVEIEKSSCLVLTRVDARRGLAGFHDALNGFHLAFSARRWSDGDVSVRVTSGEQMLLELHGGVAGAASWRLGGVDVVAAATGDEAARSALSDFARSPEGRAIRELAGDLEAAVVTADPPTQGLARLLLQAVLAVDDAPRGFGVEPSAVRALLAVMGTADPP